MSVAASGTVGSRVLAAFPGGSNGEFDLPPELATAFVSGEGSRLRDAEGGAWLDFSMGWGSALPGHAHPLVVEAVRERAGLGTNFAYPSDASLELAEELIRLSPACDRVRFCASGTEATMYCLRIARAATGRARVLRFEGAYHGGHDEGVTSLFPSGRAVLPEPEATSDGTDPSRVLVAPFNDLPLTAAIMERHAGELAGVIVEPFHRCLPPEGGFLEGLRERCTAHGVPLIFDEVVTGFRFAYGGAQAFYGVVPDLVAYGKALGGGMPIGAFGGRGDLMELVEEARLREGRAYVWTASSLGGNPVSCAAALAALRIYRQPGTYERLHRLGDRFRTLLVGAAEAAGVRAHVLGDGPVAQLAFTGGRVTQSRDLLRGDRDLARRAMVGLFARRFFLNPMGTKLYLSLAHSEDDLDTFVDGVRGVLVAEAGG